MNPQKLFAQRIEQRLRRSAISESTLRGSIEICLQADAEIERLKRMLFCISEAKSLDHAAMIAEKALNQDC